MPILELSRADLPAARARALVFEAPASRALLTQIELLAPTDATVLITGETGTGKEIIARFLHERSARGRAPFVAINCGALIPSLLESELFGHERGAFTGAVASSAGWFEAADKGTLFLDEVGDLPLGAQVKLLRVLQEREVVRVGARRARPLDVRLLAATNVQLEQAVAEGRFREDLYYRLHVAHVALAPLRERPDDVLPLARHFAAAYARRLDTCVPELTDDAVEKLLAHGWPGNIRELENVVHRAVLVARGGRIAAADLQLAEKLPRPVSTPPPPMAAAGAAGMAPAAAGAAGRQTVPMHSLPAEDPQAALEAALLALFERPLPNLHREIDEIVFRTAYTFADKNQLSTARLLGVSRNIVRARLLQYGLLAPVSRRRTSGTAGAHCTDDFADAGGGAQPDRARVRVGHQTFGVLSLLKATRALEEALGDRDVAVEWIDCPTGMHVIDSLAAGALDLGVVGEAAPVFAQASRTPFVYLAAEPPAPKGEAIVVLAASAVTDLAGLRGKSIAISRGANVLYFVVRALEEVGLSLDQVELRAMPPVEARAAFVKGEVDAWAIWNPILASLEHSTNARVLRDASGLASNRAFYVGRRAFADAHPDLVEVFLGQAGAVGRWANSSRQVAARMLAPQIGFPQGAVEAALARTPFDVRPIDAETLASQQGIADTFHRLQLIARPVTVLEALWAPPSPARRSA